jgi:uncharacterized protein (TIGR02147 family)
MIQMIRPDIFDYLNHHNFLKSWVAYLKEVKNTGLRALAGAAGVSVASLSLCLSENRTWTLKLIGKLIPHLDLKKDEQVALRLLFVIGTTDKPDERLRVFDELRSLSGYNLKHRDSSTMYLYLRHWLNVTIRELAQLENFQIEAKWIRSRLRFTPTEAEIEKSIKFLIKENYLQQDENRKWYSTQKHLDCQEGVFKLSLGEYHRQILQLAQRSIEEVPRELRIIMGHTAALSGEQKKMAEEILKNALAEIEKLEKTTSKPDELYQIELVMMPLSKKGEAA